jgi:hypothetical protein
MGNDRFFELSELIASHFPDSPIPGRWIARNRKQIVTESLPTLQTLGPGGLFQEGFTIWNKSPGRHVYKANREWKVPSRRGARGFLQTGGTFSSSLPGALGHVPPVPSPGSEPLKVRRSGESVCTAAAE